MTRLCVSKKTHWLSLRVCRTSVPLFRGGVESPIFPTVSSWFVKVPKENLKFPVTPPPPFFHHPSVRFLPKVQNSAFVDKESCATQLHQTKTFCLFLLGDFLRIVPNGKLLFFTTIWETIFWIFSKRQRLANLRNCGVFWHSRGAGAERGGGPAISSHRSLLPMPQVLDDIGWKDKVKDESDILQDTKKSVKDIIRYY